MVTTTRTPVDVKKWLAEHPVKIGDKIYPLVVTPEILAALNNPCPSKEEYEIWKIESIKCSINYFYWLNYVKIDVPSLLDKVQGTMPYEFWPHLTEIAGYLLKYNQINIFKARQDGVSWKLADYVLWRCSYRRSTKVIEMSKGETEGIVLLDKSKFIHHNLPIGLQVPTGEGGVFRDSSGKKYEGSDSTTFMCFPTTGSEIRVLPSTESSGVSFTASTIIWDEHEQHPFAEQNFLKAKPAIDAGAQSVSVWTRDPWLKDSLARQLWLDGRAGKSPCKALFYGYKCRPGRDEKWYEDTKNSIPDRELKGLTRDIYMRCNYPATPEEALAPIQTMAAFELNVLKEMEGDTNKSVIKVTQEGLDSQYVKIFKPYSIGNFYCAASDVGHGVGRDYSVTTILNVKTGEVVADVLGNIVNHKYFTNQSVILLRLYNNPLWWPENNDWGRAVIDTAEELRYEQIGYEDKRKLRKGYHTDDAGRKAIWYELIPAINNRQLVIYNPEGLKQFYDVIRNAEKEGRIEAIAGGNDDYPMAVGIAWLKRKEIITDFNVYTPLDTLSCKKMAYSRY